MLLGRVAVQLERTSTQACLLIGEQKNTDISVGADHGRNVAPLCNHPRTFFSGFHHAPALLRRHPRAHIKIRRHVLDLQGDARFTDLLGDLTLPHPHVRI